jgi:hypothetical protein
VIISQPSQALIRVTKRPPEAHGCGFDVVAAGIADVELELNVTSIVAPPFGEQAVLSYVHCVVYGYGVAAAGAKYSGERSAFDIVLVDFSQTSGDVTFVADKLGLSDFYWGLHGKLYAGG